MEWGDAAAQPGSAPTRTKLQANKLAVDFGEQGKATQLVATGNVQTERSAPGKPVQTASAKNGVAQLAAGGGWSQMELQGDVKLSEGPRRAQAERAVFIRTEQSAVLTGNAMVRDAANETQAEKITFLQTTGDIRADGNVRSSELSPRHASAQRAAAPVNISADAMQANSKTGRALYAGHAKLWQGDAVMEGESIELLRDTRIMNAAGNVRAVFPQAVASPGSKGPTLWRVSARKLSYKSNEGQAHLEQNVMVQSADQKIRGSALELYFTSNGKTPANQQLGSQQISRAVMTGGVVVEQGARRGAAERGEYTASDGKFVLSGGTPTLYDAANGTTTGRQLTFFLADDTIIVDSENGSRTLTRHRVEK
jgi:lipopolysaccharide transport protein LptA